MDEDVTQDDESGRAAYAGWVDAITAYENAFKQWEQRTVRIIDRYRDEKRNRTGMVGTKFNILWANINTLVPAVFSRLPKPDVSRRYRDKDPVGRVAALILERALEFEVEHYPDYRASMRNCVYDRFLGGRGVAWIRYEPHFRNAEGLPEDGLQITEDADEAEERPDADEAGECEVVDYECAPVDYVNWRDFGHTVARTWEEVTAVWRKVYMGRDALIERFGEELGATIPLDTRPEDLKRNNNNSGEGDYQALIFEIWDKRTNSAIWISKSLGKILDEVEDPLELENFFPCPKPLFATLTNETLVPVPDFTLYQDQAMELDTLSDRINGLIKALQVKGVYDAGSPELARLFTEGQSGTLLPVKNWLSFAEKKGLGGTIELMDIQPIARTLTDCYAAMEQVKQQVYEITGLTDIMRGATEAGETATAQRLKGAFGTLRLKGMQNEVVQFATEILQIKAQIMCSLFQPETLLAIGGAQQLSEEDQQYIPQALQLLKDEPLRNFRIEVTSDSMVSMDENQEKADRMEFLTATGAFLKEAFPIISAAPESGALLIEMLKFGVTAFKVGKSIEGQFDAALDQLREQAKQPKQQAPDPEMMKIQAESQARQAEMQMKAQLDMAHVQAQMQLEQHKQQVQQQQAVAESQVESQRNALDAQHASQLEALKTQYQAQADEGGRQVDLLIAQMNNDTKILIAQQKQPKQPSLF